MDGPVEEVDVRVHEVLLPAQPEGVGRGRAPRVALRVDPHLSKTPFLTSNLLVSFSDPLVIC